MIKKGITIILLILMCSISGATQKTNVTFINNNSETILGIVKFVVKDNKPVDYKNLNTRWNTKEKTLQLEPGLYGVTQYRPKQKISIDDIKYIIPDGIVGYRDFWVKDVPLKIEF